MEGSMSPGHPISKSYRDLPEWQEAQKAYLAESDDPEFDLFNRVGAAYRMLDIERQWEAANRPAG
jgi:hypothetical protein